MWPVVFGDEISIYTSDLIPRRPYSMVGAGLPHPASRPGSRRSGEIRPPCGLPTAVRALSAPQPASPRTKTRTLTLLAPQHAGPHCGCWTCRPPRLGETTPMNLFLLTNQLCIRAHILACTHPSGSASLQSPNKRMCTRKST